MVKKDLENEVASLDNMSEIIEAYEEIAAIRMRRVKKSVLRNREFLRGLNSLYRCVVYTYKKHLSHQKKEMQKYASLLQTNGRTVSVLLSANSGLYGDIIVKTFELFLQRVKNSPTDIVIVGKTGRKLFEASGYNHEYQYFDFSDTSSDTHSATQDLEKILNFVLKYTNVIVYHGIFRSVLNQEAIRTFVTGEVIELRGDVDKVDLECLVEPSVGDVARFFEKQILSALVEHATFESSLSKYASRMVSLDMANENITEMRRKTKFRLLKIRHHLEDARQLSTLGGIALWGK